MSSDVRAMRTRHAAFLNELEKRCAKHLVLDEDKLLRDFSGDRSHHAAHTPMAAVLPTSIEEVAEIVKLCASHSVPITPRGAGSGLEGGCIPHAGGLVIDTSSLKRFDVDPDNAFCWVGAGFRKLELNKKCNEHGFTFGPDPASNPSVGGMVSTSGSGMSTIRYGTTRENILALRVVTPQGNIITTRQSVRKSSSGLELTHLYCGSEGTLGIVCEICFKLHPLCKYRLGGLATFQSTADAVASVVAIRRLNTVATLFRVELMNVDGVLASNKEFKLQLAPQPTILIEMCDTDPSLKPMLTDFEVLKLIFIQNKATGVQLAQSGQELDDIWEARRGCIFAASRFRGKKTETVLNTDVCVPISKLTQTILETEADFASHKMPCIICAHIADGNFHCMIPNSTEEDKQLALHLEHNLVTRAIAAGGTVSGEHGIGIGKVKHLVDEHGPEHIAVQEKIKTALDPLNIMNPGTFYPSQERMLRSAHL